MLSDYRLTCMHILKMKILDFWGDLLGGILAFFRIYWWIKTYEQCLFKIEIFTNNISLCYYFLLI